MKTTIYEGPPQISGLFSTATTAPNAPEGATFASTRHLVVRLEQGKPKALLVWWPEVLLRVEEAATDCPAMIADLKSMVARLSG